MRANAKMPNGKASTAKLKSTPKATREPNGTPQSTIARKTQSQTPRTPKTPSTQVSQPAELSDDDRILLRDWLEHTDRPFEVQTVPVSRKRKRGNASQLQVQDDLFEDRLSIKYEVKPRDKWESLRRYKKFTGKRRQTEFMMNIDKVG